MEKAWLALFRFIEFWMGLPYIEPDNVHATLREIKEDTRLPGGQIDTEYINEPSSGGATSRREVLAMMMSDQPDTLPSATSDETKSHLYDSRPKWLKNLELHYAKHGAHEYRKGNGGETTKCFKQ